MILDRLTLHNFKRFRHAEIEFRDGITGILGNNGSGKSSLVSAILFALYGVKATDISSDYIVSSFAGPKDKCEVVLDFRIGGDAYKVIRTFRKGRTVTHDAEFYRNKKLVAKEVSPVEEAVKRTLGMGPVDFRNTIYAAQKDLLTLLENTPGKRKEWFLKALGIDYLKNGSDTILKAAIEEKTGEFQRTAGQLEALTARLGEVDAKTLEAAVASHNTAIKEQEQAKREKQQERDGLALRQKQIAEKNLAYTALIQKQKTTEQEREVDRDQAKKLEGQLALMAEEQAEYERLKPAVAGHDECRQRMEALRQKKEKFQGLNAELGFAMKQVGDLRSREDAQHEKLAALAAGTKKRTALAAAIRTGLGAGDIAEDRLETAVNFRLAEISKQAGTLAARLVHYDEERNKIAANRETIRNAGADGVCPLCRQKLGEHFGSIEEEFSNRIQEIEEKAVADLARQEKLKNEKAGIESLRPALDALRTLDTELKQRPVYEQELASLREKRKKQEDDEHRIRNALTVLMFNPDEFEACGKEIRELQAVQIRFIELGKKIGQGMMAQQHLEALLEKIERREEELANLGEMVRAAAFDPEEAAKTERSIADADAALMSIGVRLANAAKDKKFAEEKIAEYTKAGEQCAALQKQSDALKDEIELTKLTRSLIAEYVVYLMQVVRSRIEGEVSRIISEITGGRYEQVLLDEDFNLLVRDIDNDYPIDRFSGGEQDDIAVALRIALSRYLAELHDVHESTVLIFDEIFGSQDEERRANLLTALRTQESRFPQILLISHIAEMQGEFENTLVIEPGTGNASTIRVAE
jgi:DNA repair protein SbcC/Rad50